MSQFTVKYIPDPQQCKIYYALVKTTSEICKLPFYNQFGYLITLKQFCRIHPIFGFELKQAAESLISSLIQIHAILAANYIQNG